MANPDDRMAVRCLQFVLDQLGNVKAYLYPTFLSG